MQQILPDFTLYLLVTIGVFLVFYLIGHFVTIFSLSENNKNINFYKKLSFGFIISITTYAVFLTNGKSIFFISVFLILSMGYISLWRNRKQISFDGALRLDYTQLAISLGLILPVYSLTYYFLIYYPDGGVHSDYVFYSNACHYISTTGIENPINNLFSNSQDVGPYHYHYSQITLTSLIANTLKLKYYHVLVLVVFSLLQVYIILGAIALMNAINVFKNNKYLIYLVAPLLLLSAPLTISNDYFSFLNYYSFQNFYDYPKLGEIYILYILFILYLIEDKYLMAICSILLIVPFYTPSSPGILAGSFAITVSIIYYNKRYSCTIYKLSLLYILATALMLGSFYLYFANPENIGDVSKADYSIKGIINTDTLIWIIRRITKLLVGLIPTLFVIFLIKIAKGGRNYTLLPLSKKILKIILLFISIGFLLSVFTAAVFMDYNHDAAQIYFNFTNPFWVLFFFLFLLNLLNSIKKKRLQIFVTLALIILFGTNTIYYSSKLFFIGRNNSSESKKELHRKIIASVNDNREFAYFKNYQESNVIDFPHDVLPYMNFPLQELVHNNGYFIPVCLSLYNIPEEVYLKIEDKQGHSFDYRNKSALGRYIKDQRDKNIFEDVESTIIKFITEFNIGYIIIEKDAIIPDDLESLVKQRISSEEYVFLVLNDSK